MIRYGGVKFLIIGLAVVIFGVAILFANRAERTNNIAAELVEAASPSDANEGKLVIVTGTPELADGGVITDKEAGLEVKNALSYSRVPYQKVYVKKSREIVVDKGEDKRDPTDDVKRTEHYIAKEWIVANQQRDATVTNVFEHYENPPSSKLSPFHASGDLRVAGFKVSAADISRALTTENRSFTPNELAQACGEYITRSEIDLRPATDEQGKGMLSTGSDVGDIQVLFDYETLEGAEPVTIVGRQEGDAIMLKEDDLVSTSEHFHAGSLTKDEFLNAISAEDASSRRIGIGAVVLGIILALFSLDWRGLMGRNT